MTKREEAARALVKLAYLIDCPGEPTSADLRQAEVVADRHWQDYLLKVDAVIACIREPDEKMLRAAEHYEGERLFFSHEVLRKIWQSMFDAME